MNFSNDDTDPTTLTSRTCLEDWPTRFLYCSATEIKRSNKSRGKISSWGLNAPITSFGTAFHVLQLPLWSTLHLLLIITPVWLYPYDCPCEKTTRYLKQDLQAKTGSLGQGTCQAIRFWLFLMHGPWQCRPFVNSLVHLLFKYDVRGIIAWQDSFNQMIVQIWIHLIKQWIVFIFYVRLTTVDWRPDPKVHACESG